MMLIAFDTNILVYSVDRRAPEERRKTAYGLLDRVSLSGNGILSSQALIEFYAVVTRKGHGTPADAEAQIRLWSQFLKVPGPIFEDVKDAIQANRDHGLSIWDAMIWAVSRRSGAALLLSEDFQDGRVLDGVRFVNPFNPANAPLIDMALTP